MFKTYIRLLGFAKPISRYAVPYFFFAALHAIFNTFNYAMIMPILNAMFSEGYAFQPTYEIPALSFKGAVLQQWLNYFYTITFGVEWKITNVLILLAVILIIMNFLSNLFRYLGGYTVENMRVTTVQRMRNTMFDCVIGKDVGYFGGQRKGDIISRITSDVVVVQYCITNTLQVAFREPFLIIGYLVLMLSISWELALFSVLFLPFVGFIIGSIVKKLRHPASQSQQRMGDLVSVLDESLGGIKIVKTYTAADYIKDKFHALNQNLADTLLWMARRQQLASPMSEFLGITAVAIILVFGGTLVMRGSLSGAGFIAFIAAFSQITRPVRAFIDQFANINQGVAAGERIFAVLDDKNEVNDREDAKVFDGLKDRVEFRNVHFSYDESREIIHGVSFEVRKGETVALVGPSGGGKSTLSELMERFYDINQGDILFDGVSIRDFKQDSLRAAMSLVSQETVLFNDTIRSNIALGRTDATDEEIIAAAKVANAHNFITESPEGYDTNIGDRGAKLSGGQRQRLSIARAVLKNPEFLILDEATSALDTESEKLVQDALTKLLKGRTSVVIAHRLSTIMNADRIFVIDEGRIVEEGKHEELLAKGGVYAKLVELQNVK
ncbi:MAG: ABC transporter ATP-binding protein [Rikenellaceae bacterium]|nr:ABC transporter ATP-binding protein [Rikenellaceae bacterium]